VQSSSLALSRGGGEGAMAEQKEKLERKSSKSRLSKQDEVEEVEEDEDTSPSSETSDATIVPAGSETSGETPGGSPENHSPEEDKKLESQRSTDSDKNSPTQGNSKGKVLVRSKAVRDDASPPPPPDREEPVIAISTISETPTSPSITISTPASESSSSLLSPTPPRSKRKLEKDSSQSSLSDTGTSPCLSRDSSIEYKDSTGIDLEEFIKTTLNKNAKDRMILLKLEKELCEYIKDPKQEYLKFPQMSSYHRMLVHRCAAFFGLDHNVDQSGKCVVVNRTTSTRIPDFKFSEHARIDDEPVKQILKRSSKSFDETRSPDKLAMDKKSKSVEEREYEYEKVKKRIFNQDVNPIVYNIVLHKVQL